MVIGVGNPYNQRMKQASDVERESHLNGHEVGRVLEEAPRQQDEEDASAASCFNSNLPILRQVRNELSRRDVGWCHQRIDDALDFPGRGPNVLELLVRRTDARPFIETLERLEFKEATSSTSGTGPGTVHYCAYDPEADRIVHVRASFHPELGTAAGRAPRARIDDENARGCLVLVSGGAVIALAGRDAAGKSALDAVQDWLAPHFRVARIHMGKPRRSGRTILIAGLLNLVSMPAPLWKIAAPGEPRYRSDEPVGLGRLIRRALLARDRYRAHVRARHLTALGTLVLCDRFPLPEIQSLDRMRRGRSLSGPASWLARLLLRKEEGYYAGITWPDLLLVLGGRPDPASQRGPEDPEGRMRLHAREATRADGSESGIRVVEADRSVEEVHRELKSWIWSRL